MKSTVETMESDTGVARSAWSVFAELVKARLTALVLLTTLSGFYLASSGSMDWLLLFNTLFGTGLLACGASVLNQYMERDLDALMPRTAKRPLPSGWMMPEKAFWFGVTLSLVGVLYLMWKVNLLTCLLGALTLGLYICVYTPLKRLTVWNTLVGAIPGALPPLMGWTASTGSLGAGGWSLFLLLFLWFLLLGRGKYWRECVGVGLYHRLGVDVESRLEGGGGHTHYSPCACQQLGHSSWRS